MSRYLIPAHNPWLLVWVGWDAPLSTFFVQVYDPRLEADHEDCYLLLAGMEVAAVPTLTALTALLVPWAVLPGPVAQQLRHDQGTASEPTPLQRVLRRWLDSSSPLDPA